jgi:hypothetical protein
MNIVMSLDGVLRSDTGELVTDGLVMYRAFKILGRVTLITSLAENMARVWLMMHNLSDYDLLLDSSSSLDPAETLKQRQLAIARSRGTANIYVDADPGMAAEAIRLGITSVLISTPYYSRPEFRPDAPKGVRRWADIVEERTRQQALKAADTRLKMDDSEALGFE